MTGRVSNGTRQDGGACLIFGGLPHHQNGVSVAKAAPLGLERR